MRRRFLELLGLLLGYSVAAMAFSDSSSIPLRVLVVGAGSISREYALHHLTPTATGTVVVGVVDVNLKKALELATEVGSAQAGAQVTNDQNNKYKARTTVHQGMPVPHFTSLSSALDECQDIDIVYIGTTPKSHRELVEKSLQHGKHVLLEKPIAAELEDADAIVAVADESSGVLAMNIGMRYNRALHELKRRVLEAQELGPSQIKGVLKTHYSQWPREWQTQPWCAGRDEGGPLREVGTHFFSALLEFAGAHKEETKRVPVTARIRATVVYPESSSGQVNENESLPCETRAHGVIELAGGDLPPSGLAIDFSVETDAPKDLYELTISSVVGNPMQSKSLTVFDFCSLRNDADEVLVRNASYGRKECVLALVAAANGSTTESADTPSHSIITARHGRNAQRLLDGILHSKGDWRTVEFD
jgi:predicted dehydrogenase